MRCMVDFSGSFIRLLASVFVVLPVPLAGALQASPHGSPLATGADEASFDFEAWREHLRPGADELSWEAIPWIPSLAEGMQAAADAEKPLLLWVMNGHPLGCT
jgi:hypothetical protein